MTKNELLYFAVINHSKRNCYGELVHNVELYNGLIFDLIEHPMGQLMEIKGVENKRVPFTFGNIN